MYFICIATSRVKIHRKQSKLKPMSKNALEKLIKIINIKTHTFTNYNSNFDNNESETNGVT